MNPRLGQVPLKYFPNLEAATAAGLRSGICGGEAPPGKKLKHLFGCLNLGEDLKVIKWLRHTADPKPGGALFNGTHSPEN